MDTTYVVTGGTGGIGRFTALGLAKKGGRVLVTGRSQQRGEAAVAELRAASGNDAVELVTGDLSTKAGVTALADALLAATDRIDVLVNNAGMMAQERTVTDDGFELDFAVNVVAPYLLTHRLRPALVQAAPSRVLVLTGGKAGGSLEPVDLQAEEAFVPLPTYTRTKRCAEAMSLFLAKELEDDGIGVHIVYPGRASTAMTRAMTPKSLPWHLRLAWPAFRFLIPKDDGGKSAEKASQSSVFAATTPQLAGKTGIYIDTNSQIADLHPTVRDPRNQKRVMEEIRGRG